MSTNYKTPGVYIQELDAFGNAVVPVPTAVPVFIGYTKETTFKGEDLKGQAIKITSLADFLNFYGYGSKAPVRKFSLTAAEDGQQPDFTYGSGNTGYVVTPTGTNFRMYSALKFFYANGGADCYVVSIGNYNSVPEKEHFTDAIDDLKKEMEPTMLVIPDAVELIDNSLTGDDAKDLSKVYADAYDLQSEMINHCGEMMNRVAILDVPRGYSEPETHKTQSVDAFRSNVNPIISKSNSYAAVYYPWLHTTIYQSADISVENVSADSNSQLTKLAEFLKSDLSKQLDADTSGHLRYMIQSLTGVTDDDAKDPSPLQSEEPTPEEKAQKAANDKKAADAAMKVNSKFYQLVMDTIQHKLNLLPPSSAMAGIYTAVDNSEGVWQAPANVAVQAVVKPAISIDHETQEDLNVPLSGKSVCAIRAFKGMGNLVWGARTLDGNSNDWRYINVRRTLIYLEQSIKDAAKAYVFAPNDATTWVNVKSMISSFLTSVWKQGGLVGPKPADAFSVSVGLGTTMTNDDIQQGIMRVMVKVAVSHPAEFIEITFQQQMQKA